MSPKETVLELRDIQFSYGKSDSFSLSSVNIKMHSGQIVVVLGPNGSGKTTILKIANGRLQPDSGGVYLEGNPLKSFSKREIGQRIGFVPQAEKISFEYTNLEYVTMGRTPWLSPLEKPSEKDVEISRKAIREVGMEKFMDSSVTKLSGGQSQLILLARALAQETEILLLDEATSQLDLANKRHFLDIVRNLAATGKTIFLSTHEPDVAAALADKAVLMKSGQVLMAGPMESVFTKENLQRIYETPIEIMQLAGRKVVLWT
ncbi:MAG TPA: ABC transporter ATP-binding protein [Flexilinea sp.]|nr:ABC transporter ATP-binding protein [Flexilinea sp.]